MIITLFPSLTVLSSPTTVTQIPPTSAITRPQDIARITPSLIELTCVFSGLPKPNVTWYKGNETVRSIGNVNVQDKVPTNPEFTFSVLTIDNPTPSQFDTYTCKAANGVGELAYDIIASGKLIMIMSSDSNLIFLFVRTC